MNWLDGRAFDAESANNFVDSISGVRPTGNYPVRGSIYGRSGHLFNGTNNYLWYEPIKQRFNLPVSVTYVAYSTATGASMPGVVSYGGAGSFKGWRTGIYGTALTMTLGGVADYTVGGVINANRWVAVTIVIYGTTAVSYSNGRICGTTTIGTMGGTSSPIVIGASGALTDYYGGYIDRVVIHRQILSSGTIKVMHHDLLYGPYSPISMEPLQAGFKAWLNYYAGIRNV